MPEKPSRRARPGPSKADPPDSCLHILDCGHGDMLLLQLRGKWALVDCNLRGKSALDQFFELIERNQIRRFEFVFQTHPHADHYTGMPDILEYFTRDGRSIGCYCDVGVNFAEVIKLLDASGRPEDEIGEYVRLAKRLTRGIREDRFAYRRLDEFSAPLYVGELGKDVVFVPIAPDPAIDAYARAALLGERVTLSINALSMVLVLRVRRADKVCCWLLSADAETESIPRALNAWKNHDANSAARCEFHVIKVPHHGSRNGHHDDLCTCQSPKKDGVAAISVGRRFPPKRSVIEAYQKSDWTVLSTITRQIDTSPDRLIAQFGRGAQPAPALESHDIQISWHAESGRLKWKPERARISPTEAAAYP